MQYTREWLLDCAKRGEPLKYLCFWGHTPAADGSITKACFSQWWDCRFTVDGVRYHTAEQYMMAQKAELFHDTEIQREIMAQTHPGAYKKLGRQIRNFEESLWLLHRTDIVIRGNLAKFSQNPELHAFLLGTNSRILVEASPYDRLWGIGLSEQNADCTNPWKWQGENLLGFCLMEVREQLRNQLQKGT